MKDLTQSQLFKALMDESTSDDDLMNHSVRFIDNLIALFDEENDKNEGERNLLRAEFCLSILRDHIDLIARAKEKKTPITF